MKARRWLRNGGSQQRGRRTQGPIKLGIEVLETRHLLAVNVLTWHNDLTREGLNNQETALTPTDVNSSSFGKLFSYAVQGQVYAQPLYVSGLAIPGQGTHNVVFVATENNDVYAFDADSNAGANGGLLWHVNLGLAAATPNSYFGTRYNNGQYTDISPQVGITSTPVIDLTTNTMYVDAFTNDIAGQNAFSHHIWALDITTGQNKAAPVLVAAAIQGNGIDSVNGTVTFKASQQIQRAALTLVNGTLYAAFAGYADTNPYHGWILGFNASTLQLTQVFNTTPNTANPPTDPNNQGEAGIWQAGNGLSSDGTSLFVITGNGDFQTSVGDYGDAFLRLTPDSSTQATNKNGYGLTASDYFTPFNQQTLALNDTDLGSGGTMFVPTQPGAHPNLLVGAGKQGVIYLIDRNNLGQFNSTTDNVVQKVSVSKVFTSNPAYFNGMIYYHGFTDVLKAYSITNGALSNSFIASGSTVAGYAFPGATPSISSYGDTANGIVWEVQYNATHEVLRAYNAMPNGSVLTELYNSGQNTSRDQLGAGVKFITPTVANGHVYVGVSGSLAVYGLLTPPTTAPAAPTNLVATAPATVALQVNLTWTRNSTNESAFKILRSTDGVNFSLYAIASAGATSYTDNNVSSGVTYSYRVVATNPIGDSNPTLTANATPIALSAAVALYHLNEGTGTTTADSAGTNTGTLIGITQPSWIPGRVGSGALSFSGNGAYNQTFQPLVQTASNLTTLDGTSTLDVWVNTTQVGSNTHSQAPAITGADQISSTSDINWGTINATGRIGLYVGDTGGIYSINPINDGQWHNVAMTRDATTGIVQLYVDGVLNASSGFETGTKTVQFNFLGGLTVRNSSGTITGETAFNGQLDEIAIYNRVLTPTEISEIGQIPATPVGFTVSTIPDSGTLLQLSWTNVSTFAQNIEIQRKSGVGGTYQQIALLNGAATGYIDTNLTAGMQYFYRIRATDLAGASAFSLEVSAIPPLPQVVGRFAYYNDSGYDIQNSSANVANSQAIATDKQALLPGQTATFQNYTSYSSGLNGVMVDVAYFEGAITPGDFTIMVGNTSDPSTWAPAPVPDVAERPGIGVGGSTRIELEWDNNEIQNEWMQVTLKAYANTGLAAPDVFYFGNAIGDSGDTPTNAVVDTGDELGARANHTAVGGATITNPYDYNRDKTVDTLDEFIARSNRSNLNPLIMFTAPVAASGTSLGQGVSAGESSSDLAGAATAPTVATNSVGSSLVVQATPAFPIDWSRKSSDVTTFDRPNNVDAALESMCQPTETGNTSALLDILASHQPQQHANADSDGGVHKSAAATSHATDESPDEVALSDFVDSWSNRIGIAPHYKLYASRR